MKRKVFYSQSAPKLTEDDYTRAEIKRSLITIDRVIVEMERLMNENEALKSEVKSLRQKHDDPF